jgi:soluble lytic murein transglycosylase-like protein
MLREYVCNLYFQTVSRQFGWHTFERGVAFIALLLFVLSIGTQGRAQIYQYRDVNGVLHFSNVPTSSVLKDTPYKVWGSARKAPPLKIRRSAYDHLIREASLRHGVRYPLLKAIVHAESDFNPRAVSSKGAVGLMQIMPQNFEHLNLINPYDPKQNVMAGAKYFRALLDRYNGRVKMALAAYNAGPTAVEHYRRIPPFPETKAYVAKVLRFYKAYQ